MDCTDINFTESTLPVSSAVMSSECGGANPEIRAFGFHVFLYLFVKRPVQRCDLEIKHDALDTKNHGVLISERIHCFWQCGQVA